MSRPGRPKCAPHRVARLYVEPLEPRWLMNADGRRPRMDQPVALLDKAFGALLESHSDADSFAQSILQHPGRAKAAGLGGLLHALHGHAGYADRHGWGATLTHELDTHPRYAAAHHLTTFLASPTPTPSASGPAPTAPTAPTKPTTAAPPQAPAPTPAAVVQDPLSVAVGTTLDVTLPNLGLGAAGLTYTITPQPLPANMTFNRGTGVLTFDPAPGQAGVYDFSVAVSGGPRPGAIALPITVTDPVTSSTEVSGQVVGASGRPLAGMPVSIGTITTVTDQQGDFTLAGIPAGAGPISAGGSVAKAEDRLSLMAPVPQLLGHAIFLGRRNVIPTPLVVPTVAWSAPASFSQSSAAAPLDLTNPAMPGFDIHVPAPTTSGAAPASGTVEVAWLPAALAAQHMPPGVSTGMVLYKVQGADLSQPVDLTLPNTQGFSPGTALNLMTFNPTTGGHDVLTRMVVASNGLTMVSAGVITLSTKGRSGVKASSGVKADTAGSGPKSSAMFSGCLYEVPDLGISTSSTSCPTCPQMASSPSSPSSPSATNTSCNCGGGAGLPQLGPSFGAKLNSNAGLDTGQFLLSHPLTPYQSQGRQIGLDFQYSSLQADSQPVVQARFTTPPAGDSQDITSITATLTVGGVVQGTGVSYATPGGLAGGASYRIPMQASLSSLAFGIAPYSMAVTEVFSVHNNTELLTRTVTGEAKNVNVGAHSYGAGWSIGGLERLSQQSPGGPVLISAGQQGNQRLDPLYASGQTYLQDLGLASSTTTAQVLPNDGRGRFSSTTPATDVGVVGTVAGDFNGDGMPDMATVTNSTLAILINNGNGGLTPGNNYYIPSGYQAKAVAAGNFSGHTNGTLDLAVLITSTTTNAYSVAEYTGNGLGGFAAPVISAAGNGVSSGTAPDSMVAAVFTSSGLSDLAFNTDDGKADVMLATAGGSFSAATALALPSGHTALGVTTTGSVASGSIALVVEAANANLEENGVPFVALDAFTANGSGGFSYTSTYQTPGQLDVEAVGLVAGDFQGPASGLEVAVPVSDGGGYHAYLDIVPISSSGVWGQGALHSIGAYYGYYGYVDPGNIVAADFSGTGDPGIALVNPNTGQIELLRHAPGSNRFLPMETVGNSGGAIGMIAAAPFAMQPVSPTYRGPLDNPETLVQNGDGSWTLTEPDGTVVQFNASGQETSLADRNGNTFHYAYVTSGAASGALASITDPVGLVTALTYNSSGELSTVTDPANRVTTFMINNLGDLVQIVDPNGAVTGYGYNASHEATSETNPDGHTATAQYNTFGQFIGETLFDGTSQTTVAPAQAGGLVAEGGNGTLSTSSVGSVTDPNNHTQTFTFDPMGHPAQVTNANGGVTTTTHDGSGYSISSTDPMGRTLTYTYDEVRGNLTSITEPLSVMGLGGMGTATETLVYNDPFGIPTSITDFNGNTTTYTLDSHGNRLQENQPGGLVQKWTYNPAGQPLSYTDAVGNTTTYSYDVFGRLTTITEPLPGSPTIHYGYDPAGDVTSVTDAMGDTTTYTYDPMGRLLTEQNPAQAAAGKETVLTYDPAGNLLTATDALGRTTTYTYDARNQRTTATDPMGGVTTYAYDPAGNVASATDPLGRVTSYTHDGNNNVLTATDPMGGVTSYSYNLDNQTTAVEDPNAHSIQYSYDNLGNLSGISAPTGAGFMIMEVPVATYTYDPNGNRLTAIDGNNHTTNFAYNALNEETSTTNADGATTSYTYNGNGQVLTATDPLGHVTSFTYDGMGRVLTQTDPSGGGTTTYTYDASGDVTSVTDPVGNVTRYTYNAEHQAATETLPTGGVYSYTYNLVGELTQVVDPDGHTIDYAYNANGQETSETWVNPQGGTPLDVIDYSYDADGELTAISDNNASYQYTYNGNGQVTSVADAGSAGLPSVTLSQGYDPAGNRTSLSDSLGGVVSYTYDPRNEVTSMTFSGAGVVTPVSVAFSYDNQGNMTGSTLYANQAQTQVAASTSYAYDAANQMTGIIDKNSGGTTLVSYAYTYDLAGRVTQESRVWASGASTDTVSYTYTNNNQLTGVTHTNPALANESFAYDANGNQAGTGFATAAGNEQTASPGYAYTYDANGNMITSTQTATGDVWTYGYDFRNQLTSAVEKSSTGTVLAQATYTYDALDNRIGVDENGVQTWTLYDGSSPIMDFSGSGSLETRYLNGPAGQLVDAVLARESAAGSVAWYLPDRLGTVRDLINNAGSILDHVDFSAFGTVLAETNPSVGDRMMGFAGLERDSLTGLNLAVMRAENPATGRWTSQDPLGFAAGDANLYQYVGNNPGNLADPSGLFFGKWNYRTGKWDKISGDCILNSLADKLGVRPQDLQVIKNSDFWKRLVNSDTPIDFHFYNLRGGKYSNNGGYTDRRGDHGSITVVVAPDNANDPAQLLHNFIHEMVHALLALGCTPTMGGNAVKDQLTEPDVWPKGYPDYPGNPGVKDDINPAGQDFINWYKNQIKVPNRFFVFPVPEDR